MEAIDPAVHALTITWFDHARELAADPTCPTARSAACRSCSRTSTRASPARRSPTATSPCKRGGDRRHRRHDAGRPLQGGRARDRRAHEQPGDGQPAVHAADRVGRRRATRGTSSARPAGRAAAPRRRSPAGWCRSPTRPTAAAASASRRRRAGSSGSSRARAASPSARSAPRSASASSTASAAPCATRAALLDAVRGPGHRRHRHRPGARRGRTPTRSAPTPAACASGCSTSTRRASALHDDCVAAVRAAAAMLEGLGHDVAAGVAAGARRRDADAEVHGAVVDEDGDGPGRVRGDARPGGHRGRHRAGQLDPGRVRGRHVSAVDYAAALAAVVRASAARCRRGGPTAGTSCSRRRSPSRRPRSPSSSRCPATRRRRCARAGRWVPFTPAFNMSGQPAISLPLHWNDDGLPIGVQLVAAYGREDVLVRVAVAARGRPPLGRSDAAGLRLVLSCTGPIGPDRTDRTGVSGRSSRRRR